MPDFGQFRGFSEKLFEGQLPTELGLIGSDAFGFIGLLDTYTGAAAAYSLRRLSRSYTGDAIKVRRSSDNAEQDIGFVNNELDTSSLLSFVGTSGTDNGFVTTWYDQSGNGYDATQINTSEQPQIVSSGSVITENGKPSLQFDGSDDYLPITNLYTDASGEDKIFNIFSALKASTLVESDALSFGGASTTPFYSYRLNNSYFRLIKRDNSGSLSSNPSNTSNTGNFSLFTSLDSGTNLSTFVNNSIVDNNINFDVGTITFVDSTLGALVFDSGNDIRNHLDGNMSELILYQSDQSSNRTGIETNINDFYSIYP